MGVGSYGCGCWLPVRVAPFLASSTPPLLYHFICSRAISSLHPPLLLCRLSPRSRPRSCFRPYSSPRRCSRSRPRPRSHPNPRPCSRRRFLPPVRGTWFSPRYNIVGQASCFAPEAAGYLQAPPLVYKDNAACGMTVPDLLLCFFPDVADSRALLPPSTFYITVPVSHLRSHSCSPPRSFLCYCPRFRSHSSPFSYPSCVPFPISAPVPVPVPVPDLVLVPVPVSSFPSLGPGSPLDTIRSAGKGTGPCERSFFFVCVCVCVCVYLLNCT